jgi:hypothetical protein
LAANTPNEASADFFKKSLLLLIIKTQ